MTLARAILECAHAGHDKATDESIMLTTVSFPVRIDRCWATCNIGKPNFSAIRRPTKGSGMDEDRIEAETINLDGGVIDHVEADEILITQGGARSISGNHIEMRQGGAWNVQGGRIEMRQSGAVGVRGEQVSFLGAATGLSLSDTTELEDSRTGLVVGREVHVNNSPSLIFIARDAHGDVQTYLDARGALLAGLAAGVMGGVFLLLGRILRGTRRG